MNLPLTFHQCQSGLSSEDRDLIQRNRVSILKRLLSFRDCELIISEMSHFKTLAPANDPMQPYPKGVLNFHMPVRVTNGNASPDPVTDPRYPIDFWEHKTQLNIHNLRFGDIGADVVQSELPVFSQRASEILELYKRLSGKNYFHGRQNGLNLFFEISQYPLGSGFIEKHTHFRNIQNGQDQAMVILLSSNGGDHTSSGLVIEVDGDDIDLTGQMSQGDAVIFDMSCPHYVPVVQPPENSPPRDEESRGRWVMSLFYY